jgi:hypothetical protein
VPFENIIGRAEIIYASIQADADGAPSAYRKERAGMVVR